MSPTMSPTLALIAAVARNGVIGADNALPWRLPSDLRHFKALTLGKPVIMGRRTFESIGRPLPGRAVVVVSSRADPPAAGVDLVRSVEEAVRRAASRGQALGATQTMVAGGGMIYRALIGQAQRLYLTEVDAAPPGDTVFPPIDPALWRVEDRTEQEPGPGDETAFAFVTYARL